MRVLDGDLKIPNLFDQTRRSYLPLVSEESFDFYTTASAAIQRENVLWNILKSGYHSLVDANQNPKNTSWNPYTYMKQEWSQEDKEKFQWAIDRGLFEGAQNEHHLDIIKIRLQHELSIIDKIHHGSLVGNIIGTAVGSLFDITTLVPFGILGKSLLTTGSFVKSAAHGALTSSVSSSSSEIALQLTQDFRSRKETFLNIGTSTVLGGILGGALSGFGKSLTPSHPLHPDSPNNPLRIDSPTAHDISVRDGNGEEAIIHQSTVGAAEVPQGISFEPGITAKIPGIRRATEFATKASIIGRTLTRQGEKSKELLTQLQDMGGILTNTNKFGKRTKHSAEDIKEDWMINAKTLFLNGDVYHKKLNRELTSFLSQSDFTNITRKHLLEDKTGTTLWSPVDQQFLLQKFSPHDVERIEYYVRQFAEDIHSTNSLFEQKLIDLKILQDLSVIDELSKKIRDTQSTISHLDPSSQEYKLGLENIKVFKSIRSSELEKPIPMGRLYGHAQLWDSVTIQNKLTEFEGFLKKVLLKQPSRIWLYEKYNKGWSKLSFSERQQALSDWAQSKDFNDTISDIIHTLSSPTYIPQQLFDSIASTTGRVKPRKLHLDLEDRRTAENIGFLRSDLSGILQSQYNSLSGHIGFKEMLEHRTWSDVLKIVDDEYQDLINRTSSEKKKLSLVSEKQSVQTDLNTLKNRILGTVDIGFDRHGWIPWLSRTVRSANYIRYGAGFLASSLTDVATTALQHGSKGLFRIFKDHFAETAQMLSNQITKGELPENSLKRLIYSLESSNMYVGMTRLHTLGDFDDFSHILGVGPRGSIIQKMTGRIDQANQFMTDKVATLSGLRVWTRGWKMASGLLRVNTLSDDILSYSTLSIARKAQLASLGIGSDEATILKDILEKHSTKDSNGIWDISFNKWISEEGHRGIEATKNFRIAIERDMRRTALTVSIGDTPILMDNALAKVWLQFQTFGFSFLNKFMIPTSQRIASFKHEDSAAIGAIGYLLGSSALVVIVKDLLKGENPLERFETKNIGNFLRDAIDRSGLMGYLSPYIDSLIKLSTPAQQALMDNVIIGPGSKYSTKGWEETMFGAGYGLISDLSQFVAGISEGDLDKIYKKGALLAPANTLWRLMQKLNSE